MHYLLDISRTFCGILTFQNELHFHDVIKLFRDDLQSEGPDGTQLVTLGMIPALCVSLVDDVSKCCDASCLALIVFSLCVVILVDIKRHRKTWTSENLICV